MFNLWGRTSLAGLFNYSLILNSTSYNGFVSIVSPRSKTPAKHRPFSRQVDLEEIGQPALSLLIWYSLIGSQLRIKVTLSPK